MDYLLRDSHHTGVAYGRFDHYRLIDTLRILPVPAAGEAADSAEPALGLETGGIQSAEALMLARYFMYSQVYFHPVRRIYDIHLMDFLKEWLDGGLFSTDPEMHLKITDNEVTAGFVASAGAGERLGHVHARRIVERKHFKVVYERNPDDVRINPDAGRAVYEGLVGEFGTDDIRRDYYRQRSGAPDFPVKLRNDDVVSSVTVSETLKHLPVVLVDYVFAERSQVEKVKAWVRERRQEAIQPQEEADGG